MPGAFVLALALLAPSAFRPGVPGEGARALPGEALPFPAAAAAEAAAESAGMVGGRSGMGAELAVTEPGGPARSAADAAEGLGAKAEGGFGATAPPGLGAAGGAPGAGAAGLAWAGAPTTAGAAAGFVAPPRLSRAVLSEEAAAGFVAPPRLSRAVLGEEAGAGFVAPPRLLPPASAPGTRAVLGAPGLGALPAQVPVEVPVPGWLVGGRLLFWPPPAPAWALGAAPNAAP